MRETTQQFLTIRSIQHYLYCPHRWGLIEIGGCWAENYYVTKANIMHERVHDPDRQYVKKNRKVFTGVRIYNSSEDYKIYGETDCIEVADGENGKEKFCIVEYKPTKPKGAEYNEDDLMQVFAQKLCVDFVFDTDSDGAIYYADVKKRVLLPFKENFSVYDAKLKATLSAMRENLSKGNIPAVLPKQKCSGCSLREMCMPKLKIKQGIRTAIEEALNEEIT